MWHYVCLKVLKVNYYKIKNKTNKKPYQNNPSKARLSKERPGHRGNARNGQDSATVRVLLAPILAAPSRNADGWRDCLSLVHRVWDSARVPQGDSEQRWTTVLQTIWGQPGLLSLMPLTISVLQHCAVLHEGHVTGSFRQAPAQEKP